MATTPQQFIQPTAQANTPFLANNGNPNTAYNTSATVFGGGLPVGVSPWTPSAGFSAPLTEAGRAVPASAYAAPESQFWRNLAGPGSFGFNLGDSGTINRDPNWTPLPPGGTGQGGTGGNEGSGGINPWTPPTQVGSYTPELVPGTLTNDIIRDAFSGPNPLGTIHQFFTNNSGSFGGSSPASSGAGGNWFNNLVDRFGGAISNISIYDVIDAFIPGDIFTSSGRFNADQAAITAINRVIPGLGSLLAHAAQEGWLGENIAQRLTDYRLRDLPLVNESISQMGRNMYQDTMNTVIGRGADNHINNTLNNLLNRPVGSLPTGTVSTSFNGTPTGAWGYDLDGWGGNNLLDMPNDAVDPYGDGGIVWGDWLYGNNPFGGAANPIDRSARSQVVATGRDAQNMVQQMRDASLMGNVSAAGFQVSDMFQGAER